MIDICQVDKVFWELDNKDCLSTRKKQWKSIEQFIYPFKNIEASRILKKYFLKGETPDWSALYESWPVNDTDRHLDILSFLWLHPSSDKNVLSLLASSYISSELTRPQDIYFGMSQLLQAQIRGNEEVEDGFDSFASYDFFGKEETIFEVLFQPIDKFYFHKEYQSKTEQAKAHFKIMPFQPIVDWMICDKEKCAKKLSLYESELAVKYLFYNMSNPSYRLKRDLKLSGKVYLDCFKTLISLRAKDIDEHRVKVRDNFIYAFEHFDYPEEIKAIWCSAKSEV
ncbi:hypothetical protein [Pleionea sediminis]|uniref:hypothetical protein n=1 Tax=Pleionea sediminis TaxID=2569479 RepID=UPI0011861856|nr:hypothetical protein [Pleionea sediminis]